MLSPKPNPVLRLPRVGDEEEASSSMLDPDMLAVARLFLILPSEMYQRRESRGVCDFKDCAGLFITAIEKEEEDKDKA